MRTLIASYTPEWIKIAYHALEAFLAALWYGFPGKRLYVVGITGTKGKTSTANLVWSVLTHGGFKTGLIGTANFRIGDKEIPNRMHMTMPGPWITQKFLKQMLSQGCTHVVMEVTSEGLKYHREIGIPFHAAIFTNLSPEHLASHNNDFETYKKVKGRLFQTLAHVPGSIAIINTDSEHGSYYSSFKSSKLVTYGLHSGMIQAQAISEFSGGTKFEVDGIHYVLNVLGAFNVYNALPAIALARELGIPPTKVQVGLGAVSLIPGRMEKINAGQPFTVIVDYAHERLSINTLLDTVQNWKTENGRIITLIGAEGGGRDPAKREHMGRAAGTKSDYVFVTTTDPYDDDPVMLAESVAHYAELAGKRRGESLFVIVDRKEALRAAFALAREHDIVLATGMGAQETMIAGGKALPWNEREIIRELLQEIRK